MFIEKAKILYLTAKCNKTKLLTAQHSTAQHSTEQADCALLSYSKTEYYIRDV
jgi:hypothetical protein